MITLKRLLTAGLLATVLGLTVWFGVAKAQDSPMTEAQMTRTRSNCISAKNTLTQLHASDALLRVNRGQIYESMTTKLMSRFNSRVDSNHLSLGNLASVNQNYGTALTNFRIDYQVYEEQLAGALGIDCTKEPVAFYDSVASSRTKRAQVHVDVVILHQYIDDYEAAFDSFAADFAKTHGGSQ